MQKESVPPKGSENQKIEVDYDELQKAIEIMDETGFDCDNLKKIAHSAYLYKQGNVPFRIYLTNDTMWIEVLDKQATRH